MAARQPSRSARVVSYLILGILLLLFLFEILIKHRQMPLPLKRGALFTFCFPTMRVLIALALTWLLSGCVSERALMCSPENKPQPVANSPEACAVLSGRWAQLGMADVKQCEVPTHDGGKSCKDSSDCESYCVAPRGSETGERTNGECAGSFRSLGFCRAMVCNGRAAVTVCTD
jgi:hypothetical protein